MMLPFRKFVFTALPALALLWPMAVYAEDFWEKVVSPSGLFATEMRDDHEVKSNSMLTGAGRTVYSEEISAIVDHRPYKMVFKNYVVRLDQSFGPSMNDDEQAWLVRRDIDDLVQSYATYDHFVRDRKTNYSSGRYKGESVTLVYEDPDFGVQAVLMKVLVGNISKYTQLAIVPADSMDDMKVQYFFNSLRFDDAIAQSSKKVVDEWTNVTSPHKIFSIKVPTYSEPFFTKDPIVKQTENAEVMRYVFRDPVRRQNLYYNLYGYKADEELTFEKVEKIIAKNHIEPHRRDPSKIALTKSFENETPYLAAEYTISPTKKIPYLTRVKLRVFFKDSFVFVQEVLGSSTLVETPFVQNFLSLYKFHPEQAQAIAVSNPNLEQEAGLENTMDSIIEEGDFTPAEIMFETRPAPMKDTPAMSLPVEEKKTDKTPSPVPIPPITVE